MVQSFRVSGRKRYGPGSSRQRHNDGGNPSRDTAKPKNLRTLASCYGINPKTVAKWKRRTAVADLPMDPRKLRSTNLSIVDEAVILVFAGRASRGLIGDSPSACQQTSRPPCDHFSHVSRTYPTMSDVHTRPWPGARPTNPTCGYGHRFTWMRSETESQPAWRRGRITSYKC